MGEPGLVGHYLVARPVKTPIHRWVPVLLLHINMKKSKAGAMTSEILDRDYVSKCSLPVCLPAIYKVRINLHTALSECYLAGPKRI